MRPKSPDQATILTTSAVSSALFSHQDAWGARHFERGVDQLVEESSELLKALMKHRRDAGTVPGHMHRERILDEMADVCLCLELIAQHMEISRFDLLQRASAKADALQLKLELGTADPRVGRACDEKKRAGGLIRDSDEERCRICGQRRSECCC